MTQLTNRRSIMTLYSDPADMHCHRIRVVLAEKGINHEIVDVEENDFPQELAQLNPYKCAPTLVDRDLVLYDTHVIIEYLDERFPHPPLLPVDPVGRANLKMIMARIRRDWDPIMQKLHGKTDKQSIKIRKDFREDLVAISPIFSQKPFFMSDELSMIDCIMAPTLWRLASVYIELPDTAQALIDYAQRLFERPAFKESLSEVEMEMPRLNQPPKEETES